MKRAQLQDQTISLTCVIHKEKGSDVTYCICWLLYAQWILVDFIGHSCVSKLLYHGLSVHAHNAVYG